MHHEFSLPIIHRDIKYSNILLGHELNAKIADFGLAKVLAKWGETETAYVIAGTFGYLAPEYAYTSKGNGKIDVYSFGVVLLELVTGREPINGDELINLAQWAYMEPP
ncbi:receptor-like serine/threonine-protein kinase At1g78530 [Solanum stenotomum]|uniref:receptor-like serine/threonine-protein kinase At1g78530 n=1 Tax=Solanum stenotomum TaxID=172797 RepID=UPI0020D0F335|nr:receptor-like serine/threonine-protein kinase At1g78530 [Solanum stenotomum]